MPHPQTDLLQQMSHPGEDKVVRCPTNAPRGGGGLMSRLGIDRGIIKPSENKPTKPRTHYRNFWYLNCHTEPWLNMTSKDKPVHYSLPFHFPLCTSKLFLPATELWNLASILVAATCQYFIVLNLGESGQPDCTLSWVLTSLNSTSSFSHLLPHQTLCWSQALHWHQVCLVIKTREHPGTGLALLCFKPRILGDAQTDRKRNQVFLMTSSQTLCHPILLTLTPGILSEAFSFCGVV